jgi:hypothetical protein
MKRNAFITAIVSLVPLSLVSGLDLKSEDNAPTKDQQGLLKDIASAPFPLPITRVMDLLEQQIKYIADRERLIVAFGRGDYEIASHGLQRLADRGDGVAQLYMGVIYDHGHGVAQDHVLAVTWYRKAAEQGVVEAQNNLGVHYTNGHGVPEEYLQAYKWFYLAAAQGNARASQNRDKLARRMSAGEIDAARKLALNWIKQHGNDPRYHTQSLQ